MEFLDVVLNLIPFCDLFRTVSVLARKGLRPNIEAVIPWPMPKYGDAPLLSPFDIDFDRQLSCSRWSQELWPALPLGNNASSPYLGIKADLPRGENWT